MTNRSKVLHLTRTACVRALPSLLSAVVDSCNLIMFHNSSLFSTLWQHLTLMATKYFVCKLRRRHIAYDVWAQCANIYFEVSLLGGPSDHINSLWPCRYSAMITSLSHMKYALL